MGKRRGHPSQVMLWVRLVLTVAIVVVFIAAVANIIQTGAHNKSVTELPPALPSTSSISSATPTTTDASQTLVTASNEGTTRVETSQTKESTQPSAESTTSTVAVIEASAPTHLSIAASSISATVRSMPFARDLVPESCSQHPDDKECPSAAYFVADQLGAPPSTTGSDNPYILGHAWSQDDRVFNKLSLWATSHHLASVDVSCVAKCYVAAIPVVGLAGTDIVIETAKGIFTYRVGADYDAHSDGVHPKDLSAYMVRKGDIAKPFQLWDVVRDRLTIIMCAIDAQGNNLDLNVVITADLVSAVPKS